MSDLLMMCPCGCRSIVTLRDWLLDEADEEDPCAWCECELGDHDQDTMLCDVHPSCPGHSAIGDTDE